MRLALLLALLCCWATSPPARACVRPAANGDVFLDVRGEELRILIVNVSDACTIRFIDVYEIDYERPLRDVPWMLYWKVSDLRGRALSQTRYQNGPWYGYGSSGRLIESDSAPLTKARTLLRPGESRLVRVSLHAMMQHLSGVLLMEKKTDLPWGRAVQIEVLFHAFDRPAARGPTANVVNITSSAFVYKLRDAPH